VVDQEGQVLLDRRIPTTAEAFTQLFLGRARLRVLLESGTESEWVARCSDRVASNARIEE
jgi:hypothetical protein